MLPMIGRRREFCEDELIDYWRVLIMKKTGADSSNTGHTVYATNDWGKERNL